MNPGVCCTMNPGEEKSLSQELVSNKSRIYRFSVVIERDIDGYYASTPELQGCYSQGSSYEEVMENIRDAIRLHIKDRLDCGEEIPQTESIGLTSLQA